MKHLLHVFPTFAIGGSQMRFGQLVRLHGARYRHSVVAIDGMRTMAERLPPGVHCLDGDWRTRSPLRAVTQALRVLSELNPDVLVTYNWGAMDWCAAGRISAVPSHVHIEDGFGPDEAAGPKRRRSLMRAMLLNAPRTRVVVPSRRLHKLAREHWHIAERRLVYVPNGIDLARFLGTPRPPASPLVIGTVATLRREKNIARLIRLFAAFHAQHNASQLLIVGDGAERHSLEAAARECGAADAIMFAGATAVPEQFLARMHIFALTSDTEQMPLSALEAMASGLPIVAFDAGDLRHMVAGENVPLATLAPDDDAPFVAALSRLANDAELRRRLGDANRELAQQRYDERAMAQAYAAIFA